MAGIGLLLASWGFLLPLGKHLWATDPMKVDAVSVAVRTALVRSLVLSAFASLLSVGLGFLVALRLRAIVPGSWWGAVLSCLLLPVFLGDWVLGLGFKALTFERLWFISVFGDRPPLGVLGTLTALQVWQYGLLSAYALWLRLSAIDRSLLDFARTSRLGLAEFTRDIAAPRCRSLIAILLLISFFVTAHEFAKSWLVFKVSSGTCTSLLSHDLWEQYRQRMGVGPEFAIDGALREAAIAAVACLVTSAALVGCTLFAFDRLLALWCRFSAAAVSVRTSRGLGVVVQAVVIGLLLGSVLVPLVAPVGLYALSAKVEWARLASVLLFALPAVALAAVFATTFGFLMRMASPRAFGRMGTSFVAIVIACLLIRCTPPLALGISGYYWFGGMMDSHGLVWGWLAGHAVLAFTVLGPFALWIHSNVSQQELEFQESAGISPAGIAFRSFLRRFGPDYSFLLLFALSLVWNEGSLNLVVSDRLPTFTDYIQRALGTRPDFAVGATLSLVALSVAVGALGLWQLILRRVMPAPASAP